jgi:hypothetical protein
VKTESTTRLFTVPDYSKWARMPAGSVLKFNKFSHSRHSTRRYRLKVYPAGFDEESAGYVAVFVEIDNDGWSIFDSAVRVLIEILDMGGERAVFDNHTARSEQTLVNSDTSKGYVRFVKWRDLEASSCLRADDTFRVRCTLSHDVGATKRLTSPRGPPAEDTAWEAIFAKPQS